MSSQPPRRANTGSGNRGQGRPEQNRPQTGRPTDRPTDRPSSRPTDRPANRSTGGSSGYGRPEQRATGTRPRATGQQGQRPRQRPPQPQQTRGLRGSDLAFIFVGIVLVGALIWVGLQATSPGNTEVPTDAPGIPTTSAGGAGASGTPTVQYEIEIGGKGSPNYGKSPAEWTPVVETQTAPDFSLPDTHGVTYTLSQFKGKAVLLEFFATWCPHCQNDAPMMNQLAEAYKGKDLQILGINASPYGHKFEAEHDTSPVKTDDVVWFRDTFTVTFPLLLDPTVGTAVYYGVNRYPTVYLVNKEGVVVSRPKYPFTLDDLKAAVDQAMK